MAVEPKKNRMIRVQDSLWTESKRRADERGESLSEAIRAFLTAYADGTTDAMRRFAKGVKR